MSSLYDIIIRPTLTEKSTQMGDDNKYVFRVKYEATKPQIREAIETIFGVDVVKVNTMIMPGKPKRVRMTVGRQDPWKKAIVTVAQDQMIDLFALESGEPVGEV